MVKVVIGVPVASSVQAESFNSLWLQSFHLGRLQEQGKYEFFFFPSARMSVPYTRERICEKALEMGMDYVFFVDDDMVFQADLFERLQRHNVEICSALAFTRNPPHLPVIYQSREGWDPVAHKEYSVMEWIRSYPKNKLIEVDAVGFGSVLIDCRVLQKVPRPWFSVGDGTGEDIYFSIKAKRAGCRIFCDTSTVIGHLSNPGIVDESTFEKLNDPVKMENLYGMYKKYNLDHVLLDAPAEKTAEPVVMGG